MAYFEFMNLPEEGCPAEKVGNVPDVAERNPWSESGNSDDLQVSFSLSSFPDGKGWIGKRPTHAVISLVRKVKTLSSINSEAAKRIVGDLMFYRLALLSTSTSWTVLASKKPEWTKAYLEFDTHDGVRLTVDLERILVDSWRLDAKGDLTTLDETIVFRAQVVTITLPDGKNVALSLGDSGTAKSGPAPGAA
jgi:hypothetical protein